MGREDPCVRDRVRLGFAPGFDADTPACRDSNLEDLRAEPCFRRTRCGIVKVAGRPALACSRCRGRDPTGCPFPVTGATESDAGVRIDLYHRAASRGDACFRRSEAVFGRIPQTPAIVRIAPMTSLQVRGGVFEPFASLFTECPLRAFSGRRGTRALPPTQSSRFSGRLSWRIAFLWWTDSPLTSFRPSFASMTALCSITCGAIPRSPPTRTGSAKDLRLLRGLRLKPEDHPGEPTRKTDEGGVVRMQHSCNRRAHKRATRHDPTRRTETPSDLHEELKPST